MILCAGITVTHDLEIACEDVDVAVLLSGSPARPGSSREEMIARSVALYKSIGAALEEHASRDVKVGQGSPRDPGKHRNVPHISR